VKGFIKYWDPESGHFPSQGLKFKSIFSTDLMMCAKDSVVPKSIAVSKSGEKFALACSDNTFRVFLYGTGKCVRKFDASIQVHRPWNQ
jgi:WD40 repeat protein